MASASPPLLLVLVDGVGFDQISNNSTPFFASFGQHGRLRPLRPVLGYSDAQRAVMFTGKLPDQAGYWMQYRFSQPRESPWRRLSPLAPLDFIPGDLPRRIMKFGLSATAMRAAAQFSRYSALGIHNLPYRSLKWHRPTLYTNEFDSRGVGGTASLFSLLAMARRPYAVIKTDTLLAMARAKSIRSLIPAVLSRIDQLPGNSAFTYTYIHTPDLFAHRFGIRDGRYSAEVGAVDRSLELLVGRAKQRLGRELQVVIASDHGMNHTARFIDFSGLVSHRGFGRDYVVGIDSTMVRLWYLTPAGRDASRPVVEASGAGRFLTADDRHGLGVSFPGDTYGDDIYLLKPGVSIYPNFHSLMRPLAMHAYDPSEPDQQAFVAYSGQAIASIGNSAGGARMEDLFPVIRTAIGV